jgi:hypothetical protein
MFITNEMNPGEMLAEILKGRRVDPHDTARFADKMHDRLCVRIGRKCAAVGGGDSPGGASGRYGVKAVQVRSSPTCSGQSLRLI